MQTSCPDLITMLEEEEVLDLIHLMYLIDIIRSCFYNKFVLYFF
jgi:hypothetical protein